MKEKIKEIIAEEDKVKELNEEESPSKIISVCGVKESYMWMTDLTILD